MRASRASLLCVAVLAGCGGGQAPSGEAATEPSPGTSTAAPSMPVRSAVASSSAPSDPGAGEPIRIALSGAAPAAITLDGDTAWVLAGEGGALLEVDLAARREAGSVEVGFGPTHIAMPLPGVAAIGRFDAGTTGAYCLLVDLATDDITKVQTGELGSLTAGEPGFVWALEKADRLVLVDARSGAVVGSTAVDVGENVHVEVRWGAGSAWVGSDGLDVVRVDGDSPDEHTTVAVDEGIPFLFEDGLVWGAGPGQLWAIDPATNRVTTRIELENLIEILALDIEGDTAWIAARRPGYVGTFLRLDLDSGDVLAEHAVSLPAAVAVAPDRVWVASYLTNELLGFPRD